MCNLHYNFRLLTEVPFYNVNTRCNIVWLVDFGRRLTDAVEVEADAVDVVADDAVFHRYVLVVGQVAIGVDIGVLDPDVVIADTSGVTGGFVTAAGREGSNVGVECSLCGKIEVSGLENVIGYGPEQIEVITWFIVDGLLSDIAGCVHFAGVVLRTEKQTGDIALVVLGLALSVLVGVSYGDGTIAGRCSPITFDVEWFSETIHFIA